MISLVNNKKLIVFTLIFILFMSVVLSSYFLSTVFKKNTTTNNPPVSLSPISNQKISPLQKTSIGVTTDAEIINNLNVIEKSNLPTGETQYSIKSQLIPRPEKIITNEGKVIYESILVPETPNENGFTSLSSISSTYGEPDITITGSNFYGWYAENRIYSSKGFTVIGNPNTNEVFEIQTYSPMDYGKYLEKYGEDVNTNLSPHEEVY